MWTTWHLLMESHPILLLPIFIPNHYSRREHFYLFRRPHFNTQLPLARSSQGLTRFQLTQRSIVSSFQSDNMNMIPLPRYVDLFYRPLRATTDFRGCHPVLATFAIEPRTIEEILRHRPIFISWKSFSSHQFATRWSPPYSILLLMEEQLILKAHGLLVAPKSHSHYPKRQVWSVDQFSANHVDQTTLPFPFLRHIIRQP